MTNLKTVKILKCLKPTIQDLCPTVTDVGYALSCTKEPNELVYCFMSRISQFKNDANDRKDKLINVIYGLTNLKDFEQRILECISSLMHAKQI
jgi:hypothetical protein